jgi:hypothetical protein
LLPPIIEEPQVHQGQASSSTMPVVPVAPAAPAPAPAQGGLPVDGIHVGKCGSYKCNIHPNQRNPRCTACIWIEAIN